MEQAVQSMQRRQSRQMVLEDALRFGIFEASRRHSVHPKSQHGLFFPPIKKKHQQLPRKTLSDRSRAKSIAVMGLLPPAALLEEDSSSIRLPKINIRRQSVMNEDTHWHLPNRRVSKYNNKVIVEHLRRRLLRQHERRVSMAFEEQCKTLEEKEDSIDSRESYDEEAIKSLRSFRSRVLSQTTLNFSSTTTSRLEVFQDNSESMISISRQLSNVSVVNEKSVQQNSPPILLPKDAELPPAPFHSRPSICISNDTGRTDWIDIELGPSAKEPPLPPPESPGESRFQQSMSDSERSVMVLMKHARRRSLLNEVPKRQHHWPHPTVNEEVTYTIPTKYNRSLSSSTHDIESQPPSPFDQDSKLKELEDPDLPIGEVSLFEDWVIQSNSDMSSRRESFMSDITNFPDSLTVGSLSRQNTGLSQNTNEVINKAEITSMLQKRKSYFNIGGTICRHKDYIRFMLPQTQAALTNEFIEKKKVDLTPEERDDLLTRLYTGDVSLKLPNIRRKVLIYLSSEGLDTTVERNALGDTLTSRLRHFCRERSLPFDLIDLNFVPNEWESCPLAADPSRIFVDPDHSLSTLRNDMISHVLHEGIGTNFVCFLCNGCSSCESIPGLIPREVFDFIMANLDEEISDLDMQILQIKSFLPSDQESEDNKSRSSIGSSGAENINLSEKELNSKSNEQTSKKSTQSITESISGEKTKNVEGQLTATREKRRRLQEKVNLLQSWYLLDTNEAPHVYKLKSIRSHYKTYSSLHPSGKQNEHEKRRREQQLWKHHKQRLQNIVHEYSEITPVVSNQQAKQHQAVVAWRKENLFPTIVKESRLSLSLATSRESDACFWFHRRITDLDSVTPDDDSCPFIPVHPITKEKCDNFCADNLKTEVVEQVGYPSTREYNLTWRQIQTAYIPSVRDENNSDDTRTWNRYLNRLRLDFYNLCTMQISKALDQSKMNSQERDFSKEEVYDHVSFARHLAAHFCGRESTLKSLRSYIKSFKNRKPLVLYGPCGCGKSSVMAKAMTLVNSWFYNKSNSNDFNTMSCSIIFRSIGVTGDMKHPRLLLSSLCTQLREIVNVLQENEEPRRESTIKSHKELHSKEIKALDFNSLSTKFTNLLRKGATKSRPIVIFLDDLDRIGEEHSAQLLKWIPERLPQHVKIVVSLTAISENHSPDRDKYFVSRSKSRANIEDSKTCFEKCFETLKSRSIVEINDKPILTNFVTLPDLVYRNQSPNVLQTNVKLSTEESNTTITEILDHCLSKFKKSLTTKQKQQIVEKCRHCSNPLALEICVFLSTKWSSPQSLDNCADQLPEKGDTIEEFIHCLFRYLEETHGRPLVAAVSSFITTSHNGLTIYDIKGLLSLDRNVVKWIRDLLELSKKPSSSNKRPTKPSKFSPFEKLPLKTPKHIDACTSGTITNLITPCRIPPAILYSLMNDLKHFLHDTSSDQLMTFKWSHDIYASTSTIRYMSNAENQKFYHCIFVEYFKEHSAHETNGAGHKYDTCQPLFWNVKTTDDLNSRNRADGNTECVDTANRSVVYNLRRLKESCHHYLQCKELEIIKSDLLCNYEWLLAKLRGDSFEALMECVSATLGMYPNDNDLRLLAECLYLSRQVLKNDPKQLAAQLIGRLYTILKNDKPLARMDPRKFPSCMLLVGNCRRSSIPVLIPSGTCLAAPGDILYDLHLGHCDIITAVAITTDGKRLISTAKDETLKVWGLFSGRVIATFPDVSRHVTSLDVCMGNNYVIITDNFNRLEVRCLRTFSALLSLYDPMERFVATVAGDGQTLLVVICDVARVMKVWDLEKVRMLHKLDITPDRLNLRNDQLALVGKTSHSNNVLFSYLSCDEAYVYNVRRAKHLNTMKLKNDNEYALVTHVEISREYYVIACKRQYMRLHEMVTFELYDSINFGHVRTIRACPEDSVQKVFVNRLGSHIIALCHGPIGSEIGVWNVETGKHQHMACQKVYSQGAYCVDLQYCVTFSNKETTVRIHNLAARIDDKTLSRTQVKKQTQGIGEFYPLTSSSKYVVARGIDNGPITVWNITRGRCKGEAVSIERGLLEKNDVVVVKDVQVIVLSDRGVTSTTSNEKSQQVFKTIYIYDLRTKKYSKKLHPVKVTICPSHEYHILGIDRLLAVSNDRSHFVIWSLVTGQVLSTLRLDFSKYESVENEENSKKDAKPWIKRKLRKTTKIKNIDVKPQGPHSGGSPCHLTATERSSLIDQVLLSNDETTLLCSFYGRHVAVIDVEQHKHIHTLTNKNSMLLLHQAKMTDAGCHLVHTNYDDVIKTSYLTVWSLRQGCVIRRLKNEPLVCGLAVSENASRIVFATEDKFIKIWEPFKRGAHRKIPGYDGLRFRSELGQRQCTSLFLTRHATRAILFAHDISIWDLENETVLSKFTPDVSFQCCTIAMNGRLIVAGLRDAPKVVTLRLMSRDYDARQYGRQALGEAAKMFGEQEEKDSESSEDDLISEVLR